jgi:MFS family permease
MNMSDAFPSNPTSHSSDFSSFKLLPPSSRRSVIFFCAANFLFWAGLYLYVPILPVYIRSSGASLSLVGVVIAAYAIPQVLLRIPIGVWSDNLGRRRPLVAAGIIITSLGAVGLGLSTDPWLLFLARMVTGIGAATWVVFPLYFAAYYSPDDSGRAISLINFVQGGAMVATTAGGGIISDVLGSRQTFFIAALLGFLAFVALLFARENPLTKAGTKAWHGFSKVATRPMLIAVSVMGILIQFATHAGVFGFVPIYAAEVGASSTELGLITMINVGFSSIGALVTVWFWRKWGNRATIIWGALLVGSSLFIIPFTAQMPVLMFLQVTYGIGRGLLMTTLMALSIRNVPNKHQATAMGVFQAVYAVGMLVGPLLSGVLGSKFGLPSVFNLMASTSILIIILASLPIFSRRSILL